VSTFSNFTFFLLLGLAVLARHHQRQGSFASAQVLLERALASAPGRLSYVDLDGVAVAYAHNLLALQRPAEARAFADAWLPRVRGAARVELAYNQAVAAWHLGDHAAAVRGLEAYRARHPDDPGCLYLLGTAALELGDQSLAREAFSDYLALDPAPADRARVEALLEEAASARAPAGPGPRGR
jgi:predicted Zn-dependent protease